MLTRGSSLTDPETNWLDSLLGVWASTGCPGVEIASKWSLRVRNHTHPGYPHCPIGTERMIFTGFSPAYAAAPA